MKGSIGHPNVKPNSFKKVIEGEVNTANNGMKMTITAYRNANNITVAFEDGTIVYGKTYDSFIKGNIKNPNFGSKLIGTKVKANNGLEMVLIAYRTADSIDVRFQDGVVVRNRKLCAFLKGCIAHPNYLGLGLKEKMEHKRVGEKNTALNGMVMEIIDYRSATDIGIKFSDGFILHNRTYSDFKKGRISHPDVSTSKHRHQQKRVGEKFIANNGLIMEIIAYRNVNDIDIKFSNGYVAKGKSYANFTKGTIAHQTVKALFKIGEKAESEDGSVLELVAYRNSLDVDVLLEDGTVVKGVPYLLFKIGRVPLVN